MRANRPGPRRVSRWPTITARPVSPGRGPPLYQPARPTSGTTIRPCEGPPPEPWSARAPRESRSAAAERGGCRRPRVPRPEGTRGLTQRGARRRARGGRPIRRHRRRRSEGSVPARPPPRRPRAPTWPGRIPPWFGFWAHRCPCGPGSGARERGRGGSRSPRAARAGLPAGPRPRGAGLSARRAGRLGTLGALSSWGRARGLARRAQLVAPGLAWRVRLAGPAFAARARPAEPQRARARTGTRASQEVGAGLAAWRARMGMPRSGGAGPPRAAPSPPPRPARGPAAPAVRPARRDGAGGGPGVAQAMPRPRRAMARV